MSIPCALFKLFHLVHILYGGQSPPNVHNLEVQNFCLSSGVPFDSQMFHNLSHILRGYVDEIPLGEYIYQSIHYLTFVLTYQDKDCPANGQVPVLQWNLLP